jgi:C4-dicarboxylate transporter DctM subunit
MTLEILIIYIIALLVLIFAGLPIVFALGVMALGSAYFGFGPTLLPAFGRVAWATLSGFTLAAIPLFIFMGYLLFESGLSSKVYDGIWPLLNRVLPGGLLHCNIVTGAAFAACCGSSLATCASIGAVAIPEMERRGYARGIATGSIAAGGTLGILIPPSIPMIVYGLMTEVSVGKLFIGGIIPGLILSLSYMAYIALRIKLQPELVMPLAGAEEKQSLKFCLRALSGTWSILVLVLGLWGSIYLGWATPTEAAAVGCFLVIVLAASHGLFNWAFLKRSIINTAKTSSLVMAIYLSATLMGIYLNNAGVTRDLAVFVQEQALPPILVFVMIVVMYLVMGMLMDGLAAMVTTLPITYPVAIALKFDPVWYGIILTMLVECALLSPPVGMNLFILQGLRPDYRFADIVKGCFPFFLVLVANLALFIAFPFLITFLPNTMLGK